MAEYNATDANVAHNLDQADKTQDIQGDVHASTEAHGGPEEHAPDPSIGGVLNATVMVSLAMTVLLIVLIVKKVPALVAGVLDKRIADIRAQLDEAAKLRQDAEALKAEYQAKIAAAARDADALRARAQEDAAQVIADAQAAAADLVVRRQKMAEDKIAAAERTAVAEIRARTVKAATAAAANLIAQNHDARSDATMVDQAIKAIGTAH